MAYTVHIHSAKLCTWAHFHNFHNCIRICCHAIKLLSFCCYYCCCCCCCYRAGAFHKFFCYFHFFFLVLTHYQVNGITSTQINSHTLSYHKQSLRHLLKIYNNNSETFFFHSVCVILCIVQIGCLYCVYFVLFLPI